MTQTDTLEHHGFQAEVARLLHLMVHSVYSEREIFLREIISNASDACDKLRYAALTDSELLEPGNKDFAITVTADATARTLTIADNGIGMTHQELIDNLGTIARSGTSAFMQELSGDERKDVNLIGQFGVGFYSVFMVADRVEVTSRRAGAEETWIWESAGTGEFTLRPGARDHRGTSIVLHIKEDATEFLEEVRLRTIIKTYSDHVAVPIILSTNAGESDASQVNTGAALWTRAKSDITEQQYKEFYHHVAHAMDDPAMTLHYRAEGTLEYNVLLYVPTRQPFDLFDPARKSRVKLFVKRVFIADDCETMLPPYLRFLRGVIDSEDLPLNISREMLQNNPVLAKMQKAVTNRVISEFEKKALSDPDGFNAIWDSFGAVIKEGIYEDFERRDQILKLARFHSTTESGWVTLDQYVARMKPDQTAIYVLTADNLEAARRSPHLEGFRAKGVEVLLMVDPVDDFWLTGVNDFAGKPIKSVTRGGSDLAGIKGADEKKSDPAPAGMTELIAALKDHLKDVVKDVRSTDRLKESPVCLVADDGDMDMHIARLLQQNKQLGNMNPRILELNPEHPLIRALAARAKQDGALDALEDAGHLLLDQARILEGETLPDPTDFTRRLTAVMARAFG
ncbi:molecular chaperone HtpG [Govanella unica]|uniref:Chaperone protein HtpG n=1 Tax=Govanella unica TaxID=2975056 RepID=A0A9X3TVY7_9PROT|nr:molecular chaperone HtpG [Govania unica]MDA5192704.1 molecular chaperone HtpG [Govania unica]